MTDEQDMNPKSDAQGRDSRAQEPDRQSAGSCFEFCVGACLNEDWADWFEGMDIRTMENGDTVLCGYVVDQAALMGILNKFCRLNLPLKFARAIFPDAAPGDGGEDGPEAEANGSFWAGLCE